eukprot:6164675-Pleurochrysis_carterae.AAC.1
MSNLTVMEPVETVRKSQYAASEKKRAGTSTRLIYDGCNIVWGQHRAELSRAFQYPRSLLPRSATERPQPHKDRVRVSNHTKA